MGAFRSKPAVEKDIEAGVDQHGRSFICGSMQGWRIDQEDAHLIVTKEKQYAMYGVFDGHGGPEVSALVARRLLEFLKSHPEWDRNKEEAVRGAFRNMDKFINSRKGRREMRTLLQLTPDAVAPMEEGELDLLQRDASRPIEELVEEELMRHREEPSGDSLAATQSTQSTQALSSAEGSDDDETQASDPEEKISNNGKGGEKETESNKNDDVTAGGGGGGGGEQPAKRAKRMGTANTKEKEQGDGDSMKTGDDDDGDDDDDSDDDNDDDNDDEYVPASARNKTHGDNDDDDSSSSDEGEQTRDSATSSQEETEGKTPIMNDDDDDDDDADASGVKDAAEAAADELFASTESGFSSGTTANLVIMDKAHLLVANIGDCRAVVCSGGRAVELSVDHKPTDEPELSRITRAGSRVTPNGRIDGGLNLSRALGDWRYKRSRAVSHEDQAVSYVPDFQTRDIKDDDEFLIVACDGIWNTMESQEAVDFVRERLCNGTPLRQLITELLDECMAPNLFPESGAGCDNETAIIVVLKDIAGTHFQAVAPPRTFFPSSSNDDGGPRFLQSSLHSNAPSSSSSSDTPPSSSSSPSRFPSTRAGSSNSTGSDGDGDGSAAEEGGARDQKRTKKKKKKKKAKQAQHTSSPFMVLDPILQDPESGEDTDTSGDDATRAAAALLPSRIGEHDDGVHDDGAIPVTLRTGTGEAALNQQQHGGGGATTTPTAQAVAKGGEAASASAGGASQQQQHSAAVASTSSHASESLSSSSLTRNGDAVHDGGDARAIVVDTQVANDSAEAARQQRPSTSDTAPAGAGGADDDGAGTGEESGEGKRHLDPRYALVPGFPHLEYLDSVRDIISLSNTTYTETTCL